MKQLLILFALILSISGFAASEKVPAGFTLQILEPTGGKILRPIDWHYVEAHNSSKSFRWIISKEDTENGEKPYVTGTSIQTFVGAGEATQKSPEEFVREFCENKKNSADVIHSTCEAENQGLFTRICLETTEGDFRILYSCFWGNGMDVVVINVAGTKEELWSKYEDTFNTMNSFELIDLSRFE